MNARGTSMGGGAGAVRPVSPVQLTPAPDARRSSVSNVCSSRRERRARRADLGETGAHPLQQRRAAGRGPAVVGALVDQRRTPEVPEVPSRHPGAEVVAAGADGRDLGEREGFVGHRQVGEQGSRVAGDLVAEYEPLERALQTALEVADVVEQRGARQRAHDRGDAHLERPLLVQGFAVGVAGVVPARKAVPADQVELRLVAEEHAGRVVDIHGVLHVHDARADAHDEGGAGLAQLMHDEAGEYLGVGNGHARRERRRPLCARRYGRREHQWDVEVGAGERLGAADAVELQRRRAHREAGEATGLACRRRHLAHGVQRLAAEGARDDDRLARPAQHGAELDEVHHLVGDVVRQRHAHHEVDVGQRLGDARGGLDIGEQRAPPLARLRIGDVEAVGSAAEVPGAVTQLEWLGVAAARPQRPGARRACDGVFDKACGQSDAAPVDRGAGAGKELAGVLVLHVNAGLLQHRQRGPVYAAAGLVVPDPECGSVHGDPLRGWSFGGGRAVSGRRARALRAALRRPVLLRRQQGPRSLKTLNQRPPK